MDYKKAIDNVGNVYDLILVASTRMREIQMRRYEEERNQPLDTYQRRKQQTAVRQTLTEIQNGTVGREYLLKLNTKPKTPTRKGLFRR
jgi:DNA-directed RNA polymerase subunit K/omega